jgi:23S rRNA pseudouridine2604 synthase
MATLKLKPRPAIGKTGATPARQRAPVRGAGSGVSSRPTLAQAQAQRSRERRSSGSGGGNVIGGGNGPEPPRRPPIAEHRRVSQAVRDETPQHEPGSMRLSKRMSELGLASRREADEWIAKGWVRVDGQVVSELGSRVVPGQQVSVDSRARGEQAQRVTVLLNKPVGYVSGQAEDDYEPALVLVTPGNHWRDDSSGVHFTRQHLRSLVPAGRLDIDSVGLLVLTQDGRLAKQLIGEHSEVEKEYLVRVRFKGEGALPDAELARLARGLELDGEALRPARVEWVNEDQLRFVLTQGKKRQIRRMCEAVGLDVLGLRRVRIGNVMLGELPPGQWRYLGPDESFG